MDELDLEAKAGGNDHGHKRSDLDLEKAAGQVFQGGECDNGDKRSAVETDEDDEEEFGPERIFEIYRKDWLMMWGRSGARPFEAETEFPPMRYTDIPVPPSNARPGDTMVVFFVKVTQISGDFQWPLDVHGFVAVRDSLDNKRNYLFRRGRDNCQTLTSPQDSLLELTGPSRAILLWDEPVFEIDLKVKDKGSSSSEDDKILCLDFFGYNNICYKGSLSYTRTEVVSSKHSTVEVRFAHLKRSVEATIMARISKGSANFSARFTACNTSIGEDVVLLDTRGQEVSVGKDGEVTLQRRVVVVEEKAQLVLGIKAEQLGDTAESSTMVEKKFGFYAKSALRNEGCILCYNIDAEDPSLQEYQLALEWMALCDLERAGHNCFRGVPLTSATAGWCHANFLFTNMPTVSILIDEVDSYLVAIRRGDGAWLKFSDRYVPAEDNAVRSIGLTSSYTVLTRGFDREQLVFGTPVVTSLYHALRQFNPDLGLMNQNMRRQRKSLVQSYSVKPSASSVCEPGFCRSWRAARVSGCPSTCGHGFRNGPQRHRLLCKRREDEGIMHDDPDQLGAVEELGINNRDDLVGFLSLILHTAYIHLAYIHDD